MERILVDDRSEYTARATNPETGDLVLVGWDIHRERMVYSINGGPFQDCGQGYRHKPNQGSDGAALRARRAM
jgi:hypothetical protein